MQLGLRAKLTMLMTAMVLLTTAVLSLVYLQLLMQQALNNTDKRAHELARSIFDEASHAEADAKTMGLRPLSDDPQDIHDFVRQVFQTSDALGSALNNATDIHSVYEASIVDDGGLVLVSSDPNSPGKMQPRHPPLSRLVQSPAVRQARILAGPPQVYEVEFPFGVKGKPFGEVRVAVSTALLLDEIKSQLIRWLSIALVALVLSTILAAVVSGAALVPICDISR